VVIDKFQKLVQIIDVAIDSNVSAKEIEKMTYKNSSLENDLLVEVWVALQVHWRLTYRDLCFISFAL